MNAPDQNGQNKNNGSPPQLGFAALIVEPRIDSGFEFSVRNIMYHLGSEWGLIVLHSTGPLGNEEYVKKSLFDRPLWWQRESF